jgi:hypothetical protein
VIVAQALWIGGPPGSGKTTVARWLSRRHGLRLYSADTRTWEHRDRALRAGVPAAWRWERLTPCERWEQPLSELLAMSLHSERGVMVINDLETLPSVPLVIAEGSTLPAWAVPQRLIEPSRVLWLLPSAEFQDRELAARATPAGARALYALLREIAERDAREHGLPTVRVDGSIGVEGIVEQVERRFAAALDDVPNSDTVAYRRSLLREINQAIVAQVIAYHARPWATGDPALVTRRFVCECGDVECRVEFCATVGQAAEGPCSLDRTRCWMRIAGAQNCRLHTS